jgi:hypothetical protein
MIIAYLRTSYDTLDHDRTNYIHDLRCVIAKFMGQDVPFANVTCDDLNAIGGCSESMIKSAVDAADHASVQDRSRASFSDSMTEMRTARQCIAELNACRWFNSSSMPT